MGAVVLNWVWGRHIGWRSPMGSVIPNWVWGLLTAPPPPLPAQAQQLIHPRLYGQFRRRCAELERRGDGAWTEQLLFHGTTAPRGLAICLHGFRGEWGGSRKWGGVGGSRGGRRK